MTMDQTKDIQSTLAPMRSLVRALEDEHAGLAIVHSDGTWQLEQNGSVRLQSTALPNEAAASLVAAVVRRGPTCCLKHWWVRPLSDSTNCAIVFERRPDVERTGLSDHTLELLRTRLIRDANGVIFGDHSPARSGLLLSLTRFLPQDLIVYIGPRPPVSPPNITLLHVAPPRDDRDRRELTSLLQSASAVLYDGPIRREDFRMLFPASGVANRWIAVDATAPDRWILNLGLTPFDQAPITTNIGVRGSSVLPIRLTYLATRKENAWTVLLDHDELHGGQSRVEVNKNPKLTTGRRLSSQITSPVIFSADEASSDTAAPTDKTIADPHPEEVSDFDVASLLDYEDEDPALLMESGEIDVPGFVSRRFEAIKEQRADEAEIANAPTSMLRGDRMDTYLPNIIAADDIDDVEIPELDPAQLRRTMEGSLDSIQLQKARTLRREGLAESSSARAERASSVEEDSSPSMEELDIELEPISSDAFDDETAVRTSKKRRQILPGNKPTESAKTAGAIPSRTINAPSPDQSGQWRRAPNSSQRIIPIPSSSHKESSEASEASPKPDLDQTQSTNPANLPEPPKGLKRRSDPTDELDLGGILEDLKKRRNKENDS